MKHYICFTFLIFCISISAKTTVTNGDSVGDTLFSPKLTGETYIENRGYTGSQYFNENWAESDILLNTGVILKGEKLKYNGLLDEIIWVNTSISGLFKLDKLSVNDFWLKNIKEEPIHFKRINIGEPTIGFNAEIFAEVEIEGKISLFIQRRISVIDYKTIYKNKQSLYSKIIVPKPMYYIKMPTNNYILISKLNRSSILKLFPEQKKAIVKVVKANHLNLNTESGLISLIDLLNKKQILF